MALIKCPECGREKVSDTAEACPDCGYGIRAHFEKVRQEEDIKRKEEEKRKKEEEQNKNQSDTTSDDANMTELSPKLMLGILGAFLALVIVIVAVQTSNENKKQDTIAQEAISFYNDGDYIEALDKKRELEKDDKLGDYEQKIILMGNFQELYEDEDGSYTCVLYFLGHYEEFEQQGLVDTVYPLSVESAQKVAGHDMNIAEQFERSMEDEEISQKLEPMLSNNREKLLGIMQQIDGDIDYDLAKKDYEKYRKQLQEEYQAEYNASHPVQVTNDDCKITHSRGYYYCNGTVHNVSGSTHYYVKVKVTYYDKDDKVLTTDWTYAVSSEGIKGGENQQFEIMTKVDGSPEKFKVEILEYD